MLDVGVGVLELVATPVNAEVADRIEEAELEIDVVGLMLDVTKIEVDTVLLESRVTDAFSVERGEDDSSTRRVPEGVIEPDSLEDPENEAQEEADAPREAAALAESMEDAETCTESVTVGEALGTLDGKGELDASIVDTDVALMV